MALNHATTPLDDDTDADATLAPDRRFLVLDVAETHRADTAYFAALRAQMKAGGLQALMHDLLTEDLSTFDVRTKP